MEHSMYASMAAALRAKLRGTWLHDLVAYYRGIKRQIMRRSEGEAFLLRGYARVHGKPLNLVNPQTFTEKLFWRMITWNRGAMPPRFRELSDKYAVRAHVASTVGEEYLIKLLWQGDDARAIPFKQLPAEYVIKSSHGSGHVILVRGEVDREAIIHQVTSWLAKDYYWVEREYQYYGMKRRIVIEEYLCNEDGSPPLDYKFYCFNGIPEQILVANHTRDIRSVFDTSWNPIEVTNANRCVSRPWIPKPANLDEMLTCAAKLSPGFGFVRLDFYNVNGRVYFGEFTFTPLGGIIKFDPEDWDLKLGEKWDLSLDR